MKDVLFFQLFETQSCTYTYLIGDPATREAVLIDPVLETVDRDLKLVEELGLKLSFVLDTHLHADHITGAGEIRRRTGAKTGISKDANVECADMALQEGDVIRFGEQALQVLATPGHTNTCLSFYDEKNGMVFTGDSLMIRAAGRTDFQSGSSEKLYESIHEKLYLLPASTRVYPGHDYRGQTMSTIELEMKFNPRVGATIGKGEFIRIMSELKLSNPQKIHEALPANLSCGQAKPSVKV
jgi:glyoxylase-like metal-dependent hydrolase (beta-lactamase superfamily II)